MISFAIENYIFLKKGILGKGTEQLISKSQTWLFTKLLTFELRE